MMNWQPRETMPKDGEPFLLCIPGSTDMYHVAEWGYDGVEDCWEFDGTDREARFMSERELSAFRGVMWCEIDPPPTSLCYKQRGSP